MSDVLRRTIRGRMELTRNESDMYNQEYYKQDVEFNVHTHQRVVLATSSGQEQFDLSGLNTTNVGAAMMLTTDRAVVVAIDTAANTITLSDNGMMMFTGSFTHVYIENNSTTYTASLEFIATD